MMKCSEILQFIEDTTGEKNLTQIEMSPITFSDGDVYLTGFRVDTPIPFFHLKTMRRLNLYGQNSSSRQQIEYYMMNPDAEMWIECEALDSAALSDALSQIKKKLYKSTALDIMHITYRDNGEDVERNIAYDSRRIACKEAISMRKRYDTLHFHFTKAGNKESTHKMTDLEFATAALV